MRLLNVGVSLIVLLLAAMVIVPIVSSDKKYHC